MITIKNLYCRLGGHDVLCDINLTLEPQSFSVLLGPNGSGKSTLAKHFNALLSPPEKGMVIVDDLDAADSKNIYEIRAAVGMVFQNPEAQSVAPIVEDDVAFGCENLGLPCAVTEKRVDEALTLCGINHLRKREICTLSAGEKQLTAIAGIIAMHPKYVVFDEAVSMLDEYSKQAVFDCAMSLKNKLGTGIIWIIHDICEAMPADRIMMLENGKISLDSTPKNATFADLYRKHTLGHTLSPVPVNSGYAVTAKDISFSYSVSDGKKCVLDNISFSIPVGTVTALIGKNGCGKSTLAEILCGLLVPDKGKLEFGGNDTTVSVMLQAPVFFEDTVYDEIAYALRKRGVGGNTLGSAVKNIAERLGISDFMLKSSPFKLSGGEQRITAFASLLSADSDILILDEPMAGLDYEKKKRMISVFDELRSQRKTIIVLSASKTVSYADITLPIDTFPNGGVTDVS